jgi:cell division topological specificity factor
MRLFRFFRPIKSAPVARQRLQSLLDYERRLVTSSDLIAVLHEEILAVIARHVPVDQDQVEIRVDRGAESSNIAVDIEVSNASLAAASFWVQSARTQVFADDARRWSR